MKKIKITFNTDNGVYCVKPNDNDKENVVFECDTREEWTKYLTSLPNPPKHIVVSEMVQNL